SVFVPFDLASGRIRCVPVDPGKLQSHAVDAADMGAGPHERDRGVTTAPIQIIPVGGPFFQKTLLIIAPSLDPFSGTLFFSATPDGADEFFNGVDLGRHDRDLLPVVSQHDRMHMCVHKSGDHAPAAEVCHSPSGIGQVCLSSDPRDSAVLHDHGIRIWGGAVRGKNFSVNKYSSIHLSTLL